MTPQMHTVVKVALEIAGVLFTVVLVAAGVVFLVLDRALKGLDDEQRRR